MASSKDVFAPVVALRALEIAHVRFEPAVNLRKTPLFNEYSLCLSRACLGKMLVFIFKLRKQTIHGFKSGVFRTGRWSMVS
jgi:hypothetical protein